MKKIKVLLSALAMVAAMAFVSCGGGAGDDPTGGKSAGPTGDVVVFDPATYTGDVGEVVEVSGEKYLKVTPKGYGAWIALPTELNLKGKTTVECKIFAEAGQTKNSDCQLFVALLDNVEGDDRGKIFDVGTYKPLPESPKLVTANHFVANQWNKASENDICVAIQPVVQDAATEGYPAMSDITVYIGKITAK